MHKKIWLEELKGKSLLKT